MFTQIGSLPCINYRFAVYYSLQHAVPFLPELSRKDIDGGMLDWIEYPEKLRCLQKFKKHKFLQVKMSCVGPLTLFQNGNYSTDEAVMKVIEGVNVLLNELQAEEIFFFLDEPALEGLVIDIDYESLWDTVFGQFEEYNIDSTIHTCGNTDWGRLFKSNIDMISFDASKHDITQFDYNRRGKKNAWGITDRAQVKDFQKGDLLTLPCGMSPLVYTTAESRGAFYMIKRASIYFNGK